MKDKRGAELGRKAALPKLEQRVAGGMEEGIVDDTRGEGCELAQLGREREDDVKVGHVEHSHGLRFDPLLLGEGLTLRTMPIAARVVRRVLVAAGCTHVEVPTENGGPAVGDVGVSVTSEIEGSAVEESAGRTASNASVQKGMLSAGSSGRTRRTSRR